MRIALAVIAAVLILAFLVVGSRSISSEGFIAGGIGESALENSQAKTESKALHEDDEIKTIRIVLDNFRFEGPEGTSGSVGKPLPSETPDAIANPKVILRLVNRETVRLVFENVSDIVDHEVISPLFAAPEEQRFPVHPGTTFELIITPAFKTADDGGSVVFDLSCHIRHGTSTDHYGLGMHALIEVVPQS